MRVIVRRSTEKFTMRCLGMFYHRMAAACSCICYHTVQWYMYWAIQHLFELLLSLCFTTLCNLVSLFTQAL